MELWIYFKGSVDEDVRVGVNEVISTFVALGNSGGSRRGEHRPGADNHRSCGEQSRRRCGPLAV